MTEARFIDTNVFMYAAGRKHEYKAPSLNVLVKVRDGEISGVIDTEVIQEILYRYHYLGLPDAALEVSWDALELPIDVIGVTKKDTESALYLYGKYRDQGIAPRDALHAAIMMNNGIREIISADVHFDVIAEVTRVDPKKMA